MRPFTCCTVVVAAWLTAAGAVHAQHEANAVAPDPLEATTPVPPVTYTSSLARYRTVGETPVTSWKDANDTVSRIGGWRAYAREASQPDPAGAAPLPPPDAAAPRSAPGPGGPGKP